MENSHPRVPPCL
ncbi:hypothetical protein LINGRAHAP2_LOCUS7618 [Linum grandiflorum]